MRVVSSNPFCYLGQRSIRSDDDDDNTTGYDYDINAVIQYLFRGSLVSANGMTFRQSNSHVLDAKKDK